MKKLFSVLIFQLVVLALGYGQAIPKGMNYQAIARNLKGEVIPNQKIRLKIYLFGHENNQRINHYSEIHEVTTNGLGLFNLIVGEGVKDSGEYGLIPWNSENIWMEVAVSDKGQTEFSTVSSSKLMAVPYAIYAGTADKIVDQNTISTSSFSPPEPGVISTEWSVFGNAKTDASGNIFRINSLGTSDFVDLIMITNNQERLKIKAGGDIITKLNFEIGKNLQIGQNLYVVQSATFGDSLIVKQNVSLNTLSGVTINCGPFTVANLSPTLLTGTLTVDKATNLNTALNVDGSTDLNKRLYVNKMSPTKFTGTLRVDSTTNLNDALNVNNQSPTYLSGTLLVDSSATFNDKLKILSVYQTDTTAGSLPSGALQVGGGAYIKENFYVGGVAKFGGPVSFAGAVAIFDGTQSNNPAEGALKVTGGVGIGLNLNVGGAAMIGAMTTINDLSQSFNDSTGALKVLGGVGIRKRLNVGGASWFGSTLDVTGATTLQNTLMVTSSGAYIAHFKNTADSQGISIQVNNPEPGWANNFVEFRNGNGGVVGRIEGETFAQHTLNPGYIRELEVYNTNVLLAELGVASAAVFLASATAKLIAAALSFAPCVGLGVCVKNPIISLIILSGLEVAAREIHVGASVIALFSAREKRDSFIAYKAGRVGVTYESGAGDYAEWLPKENPEESFMPGQIVGVKNGKITKSISGDCRLFVISTQPIVLGNSPQKGSEKRYEKVAFLGQIPVYVYGKVNAGDYILPSGANDGIGRPVSPSKMVYEDYGIIVGVAWETTENDSYHLINTAIGLNAGDISKLIIEQNAIIKELESEFNKSNTILSRTVPGFKKAAAAAGINETQSLNEPMIHMDNKAVSPGLEFLNPSTGEFNLLELSKDQVLDIFNLAENKVMDNGGNLNGTSFWNELKKDPEYRELLIKDIQAAYKKGVQMEIEKLKPRK